MPVLLKKILLVVFLVIMLSFDPVQITPSARQQRAAVEFVMPAGKSSRYRRFRGRRHRGLPPLPFVPTLSQQGYSHV